MGIRDHLRRKLRQIGESCERIIKEKLRVERGGAKSKGRRRRETKKYSVC